MSAHTPGPWECDVAGYPITINGPKEGGANIVAIVGIERAAANAHLIAAAPEMLKCLEDFVNFVSPGDDAPLAAMLDDARAIIAKAKGEA